MAELTIDFRSSFSASPKGIGADDRIEREQREQVISVVEEVQEQSQQKRGVNDESIADMVDEMNQSSTIRNTSLQFVFDERGDPPVVKVIDKDSGDTIRQIPSELAVKLAKALEEMADNKDSKSGFLFDKQV